MPGWGDFERWATDRSVRPVSGASGVRLVTAELSRLSTRGGVSVASGAGIRHRVAGQQEPVQAREPGQRNRSVIWLVDRISSVRPVGCDPLEGGDRPVDAFRAGDSESCAC